MVIAQNVPEIFPLAICSQKTEVRCDDKTLQTARLASVYLHHRAYIEVFLIY